MASAAMRLRCCAGGRAPATTHAGDLSAPSRSVRTRPKARPPLIRSDGKEDVADQTLVSGSLARLARPLTSPALVFTTCLGVRGGTPCAGAELLPARGGEGHKEGCGLFPQGRGCGHARGRFEDANSIGR